MRSMRRASFILGTAGVAAVSNGALAQTLQTLRVAGVGNDGMKAVYYGMRSGIFRKYGLNLEITLLANGGASAAALTGGAVDVAYVGLSAVIFGHNRGLPIQIIAPSALYDSARALNALLVLKEAPLHTGRDFNGKTLGTVTLGDHLSASIMAWVDQNGGDSKSIKLVEIPAPTATQALESGLVSAVAVNEPFVAQSLSTGKTRVIAHPMDLIAKTFQGGAFAVMAPAAAQKSDAMRRFSEAMHESQLYTNTHLPETVELVASYSGLTPEVVARSVRIIDPEYVEVRNLQPVIDMLVRYGVLEKAFSAQDIISAFALKPR